MRALFALMRTRLRFGTDEKWVQQTIPVILLLTQRDQTKLP